MSKVYVARRGLIRRKTYLDRSNLMDAITELQLENALLRDELEACQELLKAKNNQIQEIQTQIRKKDLKIEHLKLELAIVNKSLDIVTEKKDENES